MPFRRNLAPIIFSLAAAGCQPSDSGQGTDADESEVAGKTVQPADEPIQQGSSADFSIDPSLWKFDLPDSETLGKKIEESIFLRLDADGDGKLKREEMKTNFDRGDLNQDGFVTSEEWVGLQRELRKVRAEMAESGFPLSWSLSDRNKDGSLSEDEVSEEEWEFLAQADANGDGAVTREEAREDVERERTIQEALFAQGYSDLRKEIMSLSNDRRRNLFKSVKDRLRAKPNLDGEELRELLREGLQNL